MAFEIVIAEIELDQPIVARPEPGREIWNFALARWVNHAARHHKFSVTTFIAGENLVGGEDHVFETFDWNNGFELASALLQSITESFPLRTRFHSVHRAFSRHVGIFLIDHVEIGRRTQQNLGHRFMVAGQTEP